MAVYQKQALVESKKHSVLCVDDNKNITTLIAALLGRFGHTVYCANESNEALTAFKEHKPEIVILDIGLPDIDGYKIAGAIHREDTQHLLALIALTGYGQKQDELLAQAAGFDYHLTKPIPFNVLERIIARV